MRTAAATRSDQTMSTGAPSERWRLYLIWVLLTVSLLSWRSRVFYSGGLDPTVAAKAVLTFFAIALASVNRPRNDTVLGSRSLLIIGAYLAFTTVGGWTGGSALASSVLAVRVLMVAAAVVFVMRSTPPGEAVRSAMVGMGSVGLVLSAAALPTYLSTGRLGGGLLPINPNDLAMLLGPPFIWLLWLVLRGNSRPFHGVALVLFLALSYMTGSRTGLVALVVAAMVVVVKSPRIPPFGFAAFALSLPAVFYVLSFTGALAAFVGRDGTGNVTTLNSRTIAWTAVFSAHFDFSHRWFGGGLSTKSVTVSGQFWTTQVVDSSWVSAYIQAGILGLALLTLWSISSLVMSFQRRNEHSALWAGLIVFAVIRSGLQSGLIDSAVLFVVMLIPSLALDTRSATSVPVAPATSRWLR